VPEIERLVGTGSIVRTAERFRPGPCLEVGPAMPDRVRRIEGVILAVRAAQQVKIDKARDVAQMGVAGRSDLLEIRLRPGDDFESIHRDEHGFTYRLGVRLRENVGPDRPV
jgi:hypothetical protein